MNLHENNSPLMASPERYRFFTCLKTSTELTYNTDSPTGNGMGWRTYVIPDFHQATTTERITAIPWSRYTLQHRVTAPEGLFYKDIPYGAGHVIFRMQRVWWAALLRYPKYLYLVLYNDRPDYSLDYSMYSMDDYDMVYHEGSI